MNFNQVVIRNVGQGGAVTLAVHPFPCPEGIRLMMYKGDEGNCFKEPLPDWKRALADALWDGIPGLSNLFFTPDRIQFSHSGAFDDDAIIAAAEDIIRPVLQAQLRLMEALPKEGV